MHLQIVNFSKDGNWNARNEMLEIKTIITKMNNAP